MELNKNIYTGFNEDQSNPEKALSQNLNLAEHHAASFLKNYAEKPLFKTDITEIGLLYQIDKNTPYYSGYKNVGIYDCSMRTDINSSASEFALLKPQETLYFLGMLNETDPKFFILPRSNMQFSSYIDHETGAIIFFLAPIVYSGMPGRFALPQPRWTLERSLPSLILPSGGSEVLIPVTYFPDSFTSGEKTYTFLPWDRYNINFTLDGENFYTEYKDTTAKKNEKGIWTYRKLDDGRYCIAIDFITNTERQKLINNFGNRLKIQIY